MAKKKFLSVAQLGKYPGEMGVSEVVQHVDFQRFQGEDDSKLLRIASELRKLADSLETRVKSQGSKGV